MNAVIGVVVVSVMLGAAVASAEEEYLQCDNGRAVAIIKKRVLARGDRIAGAVRGEGEACRLPVRRAGGGTATLSFVAVKLDNGHIRITYNFDSDPNDRTVTE
jgi:hypothetical protein